MPEILVTGATGMIGSVVSEVLISHRSDFRVLARTPDKLPGYVQEKAEVFTGDYSDPKSVSPSLEGVQKVFLVCSVNPKMDELEKSVIDLAKEAGVEYLVLISAVGAAPDSKVSLQRLHASSEKYLQESGIEYTILRPHSFMQNLMGSTQTIVSDSKIYSSSGEGEFPMVDARDIGEVAGRLLLKGGQANRILDITGPKAISFEDVAESLTQQLGREIAYVEVSGEAAKMGMVSMGFPEWLANDLVLLNEEWKEGKSEDVSSHVKEVLGRTPRSIGEFISDHLKLFEGKEG